MNWYFQYLLIGCLYTHVTLKDTQFTLPANRAIGVILWPISLVIAFYVTIRFAMLQAYIATIKESYERNKKN